MGIGLSNGAFYEDQFHQAVAEWDPEKYDDNEMVVTPKQMDTNKQLDQIEQTELGGIPIKDTMPFPDNRNPDTDFDSRFPKDMKSGILNDLRPSKEKNLSRRL